MPTNSLRTASSWPRSLKVFRTRGSASQPTSFTKKLILAVIIAAVAAAVPVIAEKIMDQLGSCEEIAKAFVGNWIGQVSEPDGKTKSYSMSMSLRCGAPGEVVGSSYFSAAGSWSCGNSLTLKKGGINPRILEHPDSGDAKSCNNDELRMSLSDDGSGRGEFFKDGRSYASVTLTRVT